MSERGEKPSAHASRAPRLPGLPPEPDRHVESEAKVVAGTGAPAPVDDGWGDFDEAPNASTPVADPIAVVGVEPDANPSVSVAPVIGLHGSRTPGRWMRSRRIQIAGGAVLLGLLGIFAATRGSSKAPSNAAHATNAADAPAAPTTPPPAAPSASPPAAQPPAPAPAPPTTRQAVHKSPAKPPAHAAATPAKHPAKKSRRPKPKW